MSHLLQPDLNSVVLSRKTGSSNPPNSEVLSTRIVSLPKSNTLRLKYPRFFQYPLSFPLSPACWYYSSFYCTAISLFCLSFLLVAFLELEAIPSPSLNTESLTDKEGVLQKLVIVERQLIVFFYSAVLAFDLLIWTLFGATRQLIHFWEYLTSGESKQLDCTRELSNEQENLDFS